MATRSWSSIPLLLVSSVCVIAGFSLSCSSCSRNGPGEIRLGAPLPLTGKAAQFGSSARNAIELAVSQVNAAGGVHGQPVKVFYEDSKLDPKDALSAVTKLISFDKVKALIGGMSSSEVEAVLPTCNKAKILLISPSATDHELSGVSPYFFRTIVSDTYEGKAMAQFAFSTMGYRRLAIIYVESAGPFGVADTLRQDFQKLGGTVVTVEKAPVGATDLRSQLARVQSSKADALYFAGFPEETTTMLRQAKELGIKQPLLAHGTAEAPEVRKNAGKAADGLIFASSTLEPDAANPSVRAFYDDYKRRYEQEPQTYAANAFDAAALVLRSMAKYGTSTDAIRRGLLETKDYDGATGKLSFTPNGDVQQPIQIKIIRDGKIVPYGDR